MQHKIFFPSCKTHFEQHEEHIEFSPHTKHVILRREMENPASQMVQFVDIARATLMVMLTVDILPFKPSYATEESKFDLTTVLTDLIKEIKTYYCFGVAFNNMTDAIESALKDNDPSEDLVVTEIYQSLLDVGLGNLTTSSIQSLSVYLSMLVCNALAIGRPLDTSDVTTLTSEIFKLISAEGFSNIHEIPLPSDFPTEDLELLADLVPSMCEFYALSEINSRALLARCTRGNLLKRVYKETGSAQEILQKLGKPSTKSKASQPSPQPGVQPVAQPVPQPEPRVIPQPAKAPTPTITPPAPAPAPAPKPSAPPAISAAASPKQPQSSAQNSIPASPSKSSSSTVKQEAGESLLDYLRRCQQAIEVPPTSPTDKQSVNSPTEKTICPYYLKYNRCDYGANCKYSHDRMTEQQAKTAICKQFQELGTCFHGSKCQLKHIS
jgi:CCCH-type zinc finger